MGGFARLKGKARNIDIHFGLALLNDETLKANRLGDLKVNESMRKKDAPRTVDRQ